jgi:hypothetical protein
MRIAQCCRQLFRGACTSRESPHGGCRAAEKQHDRPYAQGSPHNYPVYAVVETILLWFTRGARPLRHRRQSCGGGGARLGALLNRPVVGRSQAREGTHVLFGRVRVDARHVRACASRSGPRAAGPAWARRCRTDTGCVRPAAFSFPQATAKGCAAPGASPRAPRRPPGPGGPPSRCLRRRHWCCFQVLNTGWVRSRSHEAVHRSGRESSLPATATAWRPSRGRAPLAHDGKHARGGQRAMHAGTRRHRHGAARAAGSGADVEPF